MIVGILLVQAVAFAVLSAIVASNKNRDTIGWGVLGFLFGLFAFIAALVVSDVEDGQEQSASRGKSTPSGGGQFNPDEHEKKCPRCAEYIKLEAKACRYCGHEFSEEEVERQIEKRKQEVENQRERRKEREVKDPKDLEAPPPDEVAARCGDCHYPLRGNEKRCPRCQRKLVWS